MKLSHFIVCTDAGLASNENRAFNNIQNRSYIVTYRILKTEFKSKLVYLKNDDRIKAYFTTCFITNFQLFISSNVLLSYSKVILSSSFYSLLFTFANIFFLISKNKSSYVF